MRMRLPNSLQWLISGGIRNGIRVGRGIRIRVADRIRIGLRLSRAVATATATARGDHQGQQQDSEGCAHGRAIPASGKTPASLPQQRASGEAARQTFPAAIPLWPGPAGLAPRTFLC